MNNDENFSYASSLDPFLVSLTNKCNILLYYQQRNHSASARTEDPSYPVLFDKNRQCIPSGIECD